MRLDRFPSLRGRSPKQSRSRKIEASFWIAAAVKGRLAMTVLRRNGHNFWRLVLKRKFHADLPAIARGAALPKICTADSEDFAAIAYVIGKAALHLAPVLTQKNGRQAEAGCNGRC